MRKIIIACLTAASSMAYSQTFNLEGDLDYVLDSGLYNNVRSWDSSHLTINKPLNVRYGVSSFDESTMSIAGGEYPVVTAQGNSKLDFFDGSVSSRVSGFGNATLNIYHADIAYELYATENSIVNFRDGTVLDAIAKGEGIFNQFGGSIRNGNSFENGTYNWFNGQITGHIYLSNAATINIYGKDFSLPTEADLLPLFSSNDGSYKFLSLSFTQVDGDYVSVILISHTYPSLDFEGSINLITIPEPNSIFLVLLLTACMLYRRKQTDKNPNHVSIGD